MISLGDLDFRGRRKFSAVRQKHLPEYHCTNIACSTVPWALYYHATLVTTPSSSSSSIDPSLAGGAVGWGKAAPPPIQHNTNIPSALSLELVLS